MTGSDKQRKGGDNMRLEERVDLCQELNQMAYLRGKFLPASDAEKVAYQVSVNSKPTWITEDDLTLLHRAMLDLFKAQAAFNRVVGEILDVGFTQNLFWKN